MCGIPHLAFALHSSKTHVFRDLVTRRELAVRMYLLSTHIVAASFKYAYKMDCSLGGVAARILSDNELVICAYSPTG